MRSLRIILPIVWTTDPRMVVNVKDSSAVVGAAAQVFSRTISPSGIPATDASKVASGLFNTYRATTLDASYFPDADFRPSDSQTSTRRAPPAESLVVRAPVEGSTGLRR